MRKIDTKKVLLTRVPALILLVPLLVFGQIQSKIWSDGVPGFFFTKPGSRVVIDETVHLEPLFGMAGEAETLDFVLNGVDWQWPQSTVTLGEAEDIDYRNIAGQDLYLVTDTFNKKVTEVKVSGSSVEEVWSFGSASLLLPVDAYVFSENNLDMVLITDRGTHRVSKINRTTKAIVWQYGSSEGGGFNQLSSPADAMKIPDSSQYIIADNGNSRVIIVDEATKDVLWELGSDSLRKPVDVEYLPTTSEILITDSGKNRVFKIRRDSKEITWQIGATDSDGQMGLSAPTDADVLINGNVLIADAGHNRIIEVDPTGKIIWQFRQLLEGLKDVDLLPDNRLLAVYRIAGSEISLPARLGFKSSWVDSKSYQVSRDVNFDQLSWQADTLAGVTSVQLKVRSGITESEMQRSPWYGPSDDTTAVFKSSGQALGAVHKGHRWYQVRAYLATNDPRESPMLKSALLRYYYYDSSQDNAGGRPYFFTGPIGLDNEQSMPKWKNLIYRTVLPGDAAQRSAVHFNIRIMNKAGTVRLYEFDTSSQAAIDTVLLENIQELQRTKSIMLIGTPITTNSALTPELAYWEIQYDSVGTTRSSVKFVKTDGTEAPFYQASVPNPPEQGKFDRADIILDDNDSEQFYGTRTVSLTTVKSHDRMNAELSLQTPLYFRSIEPFQILVSSNVDTSNNILEVSDRDTIIARYQDVIDALDTSADSVLVLNATKGNLAIENYRGVKVTTVSFGEALFVHITNEQDRNISPVLRDSVKVTLRNSAPLDEEEVTLYELQSQTGIYNSGEFRNENGLRIELNSNGIFNDGKIQSLPGQVVTASYTDDFDLNQAVTIPDSGGTVVINLGGEPYVVEVAPNPFYEKKYDNFRLRIASASGSLTVRLIEIYNLAGELVRTLDASAVDFSTGLPIPNNVYGIAEHWWNLRNESGSDVASGTYWVKVHADLANEDTSVLERVVFIRKFALVR
jgi:hypothetical protein